uniref:Protein translocase subunit SecF n=1 Tax=Candidatus Actinomarina minuta TaxID=1389454 RepID=S5DRM0_9ACTN|nr:preprotein translocase subunit SecF [Candidatus Actinomarina minuta]
MFKKLFLGTTNVDFQKLGSRFYKIFIIEFILFITIILSSLFGIFTLNLSVDFTGGTTYQLSTTYTDNDINDVLNNDILQVSRYQTFENSDTIIFRAIESSQEIETDLLNYLSDKFNVATSEIDFQRVGPTFGQDITEKGIRALVIFITIIALLISIRYEYKYAFIALVALLHDLLLTFSIYIVIGLEITPSTVIALLTILGYSLYDTVILFDKLKDSQRTFKIATLNKEVLNKTFNEVLMRSINTSLTSAIPIISIIFIGNYLGIEGNLSDFAIPLLIGIISGTYSSIFVTVPFLSKIIKTN